MARYKLGRIIKQPPRLQALSRSWRSQQGEYRAVYLASVNGSTRVQGGMVWVHDLASGDANGNATYGAPYQLPIYPGAAVDTTKANFRLNLITYKGREYVFGMDFDDMVSAGYEPHQTNPIDPSRKYVQLAQIADLLSLPLGDDTVRIEPGLYEKQDGTYAIHTASAASPYVDILTEYVPADEDDSTIVCLWLDTYTNTVSTTQSSEFAQSATILFTPSEALTYINEAAADRPPDAIGIRCYLVNGDTTVMNMTTLFHDLRPFLHSLKDIGFPYADTRHYRVWDNHYIKGTTCTFVDKTLTVYGTLDS